MRRIGTVLVITAAALLAWFAAGELAWPARGWTSFLMVGLPALLVAQARALATVDQLPRVPVYLSSIVSLWGLALLTALVARGSGIAAQELGIAWIDAPAMLAWTIGLIGIALALVLLFRAVGVREAPLLAHLLPKTAGERLLFAGVAVTAGVCEELVFRGFLLPALNTATGSLALALVLSSGSFGIMHAYQRPSGAARATLLGLLLAIPVVATGSILPSIAAHAGYDLIAGLLLGERLVR